MTQNPRHFGFAQVPRLVTRGPKARALSLIEKGLYACIKDICGDDGECYFTLRNLAQEIQTSISTLSRYIPRLRDAGLIEAEKKPGAHNKHEIWHIRVTDIWSENDTLYAPTTTSQDCFNGKQKIVSGRNKDASERVIVSDGNNAREGKINSVSHRNSFVSSRNKSLGPQAQDCFYLTSRIIDSNNTQNNNTSSFGNDGSLIREPVAPHASSSLSPLSLSDSQVDIRNPVCEILSPCEEIDTPIEEEAEEGEAAQAQQESEAKQHHAASRDSMRPELSRHLEATPLGVGGDGVPTAMLPQRDSCTSEQVESEQCAHADDSDSPGTLIPDALMVDPVGVQSGNEQATDWADTSSEQGRERAEEGDVTQGSPPHSEPQPEERIPKPTKPEMPPNSAKWPNKETALLIAQAIRGQFYTDKQRKDDRNAAEKMFRDYPTLTREQFTTIFQESYDWWQDKKKGKIIIATLLCKSKTDGKVHLERSLEIMEQRKEKSNGHSPPEQNGGDTSTSSVGVSGMKKLTPLVPRHVQQQQHMAIGVPA